MENKAKIDFTSKITPVKPINDQMTLCKCYIMAVGENRNRSNISKEAVDNALPTIYNIPIVGHLFVDDDNETRMGGHDRALEKDANGKYVFKVLTVPFGVVPQQNDIHYEEVKEQDGTTNTYLVGDIILWTGRYPEILDAKYDDSIYFNQSMEILPIDSNKKDGITYIDAFQFSALCLLGKSDDKGKNVEPCFKSARVEPYSFSGEWTKLFAEFKEELAKCYQEQNIEKGGNKALTIEDVKTIMSEFGVTEDAEIPFEITDDMTEDAVRERLAEIYTEQVSTAKEEENVDEQSLDNPDSKEVNSEDSTSDFETSADEETETVKEESAKTELFKSDSEMFAKEMTNNEIREALFSEVSKLCVWTESDCVSYCLVDFDSRFAYVRYYICGESVDERSGYERIPYSTEEGKTILKTAESKEVRLCWLTKEDEDALDAKNDELNALRKYKEDRLADDKQKAYGAILSEFTDLAEDDEFKQIASSAMTFESAEALKEKCYAIRGKKVVKTKDRPLSTRRFPVGFGAEETESDKDAFYGKYVKKSK